MPAMTLSELAAKMAAIDIAILSTHGRGGVISARPMRNNGQVEPDATSYYFTTETADAAADIARNNNVALGFQGAGGFCLAVEGAAALIRDPARFARRWTRSLDRRFPDGPQTPGLVMIEVEPGRLRYWDGPDDGEIRI